MILSAFIAVTIDKLNKAGIDNPQLDTRLLACHAWKCSRVDLLSQSRRELTTDEIAALDALIARRLLREPVARIIGTREFWGLEFGLNEATLEPRPDSETLIEVVLSSWRLGNNVRARLLDLGTGTGCLLMALLQEFPHSTGIGIDFNHRVIEQARRNANFFEMNNRSEFIVSNWFEKIDSQTFDIIVSNPPYIPSSDIPTLMPEVREYDPALALDGGIDGLNSYRFLVPQLTNFLNPEGIAVFEVGIGQAQEVADLFRQAGFRSIAIHRDLAGLERCVSAR